MCKNTHVPDKLEGYLLQSRHALYNLILLEDGVVSVEAIDDVAIETESSVVAQQTKSVLSNNNPITDKAVVFWKTLYNWSCYIDNGDFMLKTPVLRYVVVSSHKLTVGKIPDSFFKAKNEDEAKKALDDARCQFYDDSKLSPKVSNECKPFIEYCFSSENEKTVVQAIIATELELHENSYDDELKTKFTKQIIPQEYVDELFIYMLGWVENQIHKFTKENKPAYISASDYREALIREIRGRNTNDILSAVSTSPDSIETNIELERHDTYIKQLELINLNSTDIYCAASDYLRTKSEIVEWAKRGLVTQQSFEDYNDGLKRMWGNEKRLNDFMSFADDEKKGQSLYSKCHLGVSGKELQGKVVPSFFGSGALHSLANEPSHSPQIGWHPNYIDLLKEDDNE